METTVVLWRPQVGEAERRKAVCQKEKSAVKSLSQEHNRISQVGFEPPPYRSRSKSIEPSEPIFLAAGRYFC